jgi:ribosomal protein S1
MFFQEAQRGLRAARELVEDLKCQIATMIHSEEKISWENQKRSWQEERQRLESMILDLNATIERLHISVREIAAERERARETLDLNKSQAQVDSAQREKDRIRSSERR